MRIKDFVFPDFEQLKPLYIQQCIREMKKFSKEMENNIEELSKERYEICIEKIKKGEPLFKRDYVILAYSLSRLENDGYLRVFFNLFLKNLNSFLGVSSFVRPLVSYIYNNTITENSHMVYALLRKLRMKLPERPRYVVIKDMLKRNTSLSDSLEEIKNNIENKEKMSDIEKYCADVFMRDNDRAYYRFIKDFIVKNHLSEDLWPQFKRLIGIMSLEDKKAVFRGILLCYKDNPSMESYPERWFTLIWQELEDPYDPYNTLWRGMEDVKDVFRLWYAYTSVLDFFINRIRGGDRRRCNFWMKYINSIYRVRYFPEANMALVMEFANHIIVEFAQPNNACYIYSKEHLSMEDIERKLTSGNLSASEKVNLLKDKSLCLYRLSHRERWETEFDYILWKLRHSNGR